MPERSRLGPLKVLFLPAWYPSEVSPLSGVFIRDHARAASLYNDVAVVYAYHSPNHKVKGLCQVTEAVEDGLRTVRIRYRSPSALSYSPASRLIRLWTTMSYLRRLVSGGWRPDVIHAHVYSAAVPAVIVGGVYRIPVVITEHWSWFALRKLTWERRLAARVVFNRARMVLPVSEHLRKQIEHYRVRANFRVVPNVVDTRLFHPQDPQQQDEDSTKRILFVAHLSDDKGIAHLLHALKQVSERRQDFFLDVVGDAKEGATRQDYEKACTELGLDSMVRFHGAKPKEEVAGFMRRCHFFVQPSLHETFGVVYIEAMACGKPVIASDIPGPNEFINNDLGVLVPPRDVGAIAEAIDYMLDNYNNYSPQKLTEYVKRFSHEEVGKKLDEVYREAIGK